MDSNTLLMNTDGTFPVSHDGNVIVYGAGRNRHLHKSLGGSVSGNNKLMQNLSLFDGSTKRGGSMAVGNKPNFQRKPFKFII